MKIVVLDSHGLDFGDMDWSALAAIGQLSIHEQTAPDQVAERIKDATIVLTNKTALNRQTIANAEMLRFIGVLATGFDVVDVAAAAENDVVVSNVPTYGTASVAQLATALLLELCHHVGRHDADVHSGGWLRSDRWCYWLTPLVELDGKTAGIIGFGRIGQNFAAIARALGMRVLAYDAYPDKALETENTNYVPLEMLFAQADVISLHCPLTTANRGMINKKTIAQMKKGAFIINTSRGPLINDRDLADALNSGHLGGAAVDVVSTEPPPADNPLLAAKNCIITPHMAWGTFEARTRIMQTVTQNVAAFLGGAPQNVVSQRRS